MYLKKEEALILKQVIFWAKTLWYKEFPGFVQFVQARKKWKNQDWQRTDCSLYWGYIKITGMKHSVFYLPVRIFYLLYISDLHPWMQIILYTGRFGSNNPFLMKWKTEENANVRFTIRITGSYFRNRRNEVNTYVIITDINKNKNRI